MYMNNISNKIQPLGEAAYFHTNDTPNPAIFLPIWEHLYLVDSCLEGHELLWFSDLVTK